MKELNRDPGLNQQVLTLQIIAGALILGVVVFAAIVAFFLGAWNAREEQGAIKYVGLVLAGLTSIPLLLVPSFIRGQRVAPDQLGQLLGIYQTRMIVRFALLEGAAFLNLVAFLIEHARWSLGVAGVLVVAMLAMFPARTRVEHWVEAEQIRSGRA